MGNTDSIPVVSQVKSAVQAIGGDSAGALQTQQNFAYNNTFPVISQIASAGYAIGGDMDRARDLQEKFASDMSNVIDSIPVAGHIKGSVHFALGENEKGENSMKAASRSTGVVLGGVGGFVAGGPVGAVAGGIAGGAAVDGIITGSEIIAHGPTARPYGYIAVGKEIAEAAKGNRNISTVEGFDMAMLPVSDGIGGYASGSIIKGPGAGKAFGYSTLDDTVIAAGKKGGNAGGMAGKVQAKAAAAKAVEVEAAAKNAGQPITNVITGVIDENSNAMKPSNPSFNRWGLDQKALNNRANQLNPNHVISGPGRPAGYRGAGTLTDLNNHANQLNPNNPIFQG